MGGVKVGGRRIKCIGFADDMTLLAEEEMMLRNVLRSYEQYGMINANKTKTMVVGRKIKKAPYSDRLLNYLVGEHIERAFFFDSVLERRTTPPGRRDIIYPDDRDYIDMGLGPQWPAPTLEGLLIFLDNRVSTEYFCTVFNPAFVQKYIRLRLYNIPARPVLSYGSEAWALRSHDISRMIACEVRFMRSIVGFTKFDHERNENIIEQRFSNYGPRTTCGPRDLPL
ncbi:hypothetical protein ANN_09301 [Periplaneta americana]|uniref:Reverse transcriptase domain-containing protein n=1 Tax=Periplaneta americana TaxID=6978 RepID=A0ABQ8TLD4_PERAM|nr:hypothetical protein ANN_09301 [Periplaneta americana]